MTMTYTQREISHHLYNSRVLIVFSVFVLPSFSGPNQTLTSLFTLYYWIDKATSLILSSILSWAPTRVIQRYQNRYLTQQLAKELRDGDGFNRCVRTNDVKKEP